MVVVVQSQDVLAESYCRLFSSVCHLPPLYMRLLTPRPRRASVHRTGSITPSPFDVLSEDPYFPPPTSPQSTISLH